METVLIQLTSSGTMKLLNELEELNLLRVIKKETKKDILLSEKYANQLPVEIAEQLQNHIENSRSEWDRNL